MVTDEPAVLTWMIALAPRPRHRIGRHWWRELVTEQWRAADDAWSALRESGADVGGWTGAVTSAYQLEEDEFRERFPRPRLRDFMVGLSHGAIAP